MSNYFGQFGQPAFEPFVDVPLHNLGKVVTVSDANFSVSSRSTSDVCIRIATEPLLSRTMIIASFSIIFLIHHFLE